MYEFWGDIITNQINEDLAAIKSELLVNLASDEYYKSVNEKKIKADIVKPIFMTRKMANIKSLVSMLKARGLMARFIIENQLNKAEELKAFNTEGYYFDADNSSAKELVFKRDEQVA